MPTAHEREIIYTYCNIKLTHDLFALMIESTSLNGQVESECKDKGTNHILFLYVPFQ